MSSPLIYFFRHGQTDWNAEQRFQGQRDIPLNDVGREQAATNGATLASLIDDSSDFDFISSPLSRTRETMEIVREKMGLSRDGYQLEERIIEISFGDWEGQTLEELSKQNQAEAEKRAADKWNYMPPGGENYATVHERVALWLATVERPSIVSCHGGILRALMLQLQGVSQEEAALALIPQDKLFLHESGEGKWLT